MATYLRRITPLVCIAAMLTGSFAMPAAAQPAKERFFTETGHKVQGLFLDYWNAHGGLAQQGYPISEEMFETSELDGKRHKVQYFERAVFERHSENKPPYDLLLMQLGTFRYKALYGEAGASNQKADTGGQFFKATGFYVGGSFLKYWNAHGGLAQQGYPISNEFQETSVLDGKTYIVQYFERAEFELHPENKPPYDLLLSQLGTLRIKARNPGPPHSGATPTPAAGQTPAPPPSATKASGSTGSCKPVSDTLKSKIASTGPVAISNLNNSGQEYVELINSGAAPVDIAGWTLRDKNDIRQKYLFPPGSRLDPGSTLQVYTEAGHPYSFNRKGSIWNNCGDAVELLDTTGSIVATYAYGTHLIQ